MTYFYKQKSFINVIAIILSLLLMLLSNVYCYSFGSFGNHNQTISARLNKQLLFNCSKVDTNEYKLKYIINNKTRAYNSKIISKNHNLNDDDLIEYFDSYEKLKSIDANLDSIESMKFSDSGRYYCIYENYNKKYTIRSFLVNVYDLEDVSVRFGETKQLKANIAVNENTNNLFWYTKDSELDKYKSLESDESVQINKNELTLVLNNQKLFKYYLCINKDNNAYIQYKLICSGLRCLNNPGSRLNAPIITPSNAKANPGSSIVFTCNIPDQFSYPDNYEWYKIENKNNNDEDMDNNTAQTEMKNTLELSQPSKTSGDFSFQFIAASKQYEIDELSTNHTGWYYCCFIFGTLQQDSSDQAKRICSSAHLNVTENMPMTLKKTEKAVHKGANLTITLTLIVASLIVIGILVAVIVCFYKKFRAFKDTQICSEVMNKNQIYQPPPNFTFSNGTHDTKLTLSDNYSSIDSLLSSESGSEHWKIPIDTLQFGTEIGKGAFGVVMYGEIYKTKQIDVDKSITYKTPVAVKKLKEYATPHNIHEIYEELKLMLKVGRHENIVNLIGYSVDEGSLFIVTEFAKYGNLKDYLRNFEEKIVQRFDKIYLILYSYQIAKGMEYLHKQNVLHRDLAARNILVAEKDLVKIADFGLARNIETDYYYMKQADGRFPLKWMSPEALTHKKISKESDIWSYGILLWEIFTYGTVPYPSVPPEKTLEFIQKGCRLEQPKDCDTLIYDIMTRCWNMNTNERPSFSELSLEFEKIFNSKNHNTNIKLSSVSSYDSDINESTHTIDKCNCSEHDKLIDNNLSSPSIPYSSVSSSLPSSSSSFGCSDTDFYGSHSNRTSTHNDNDEHRDVFISETKPFLPNEYCNNVRTFDQEEQSLKLDRNRKYAFSKKVEEFNLKPTLKIISPNQQQKNFSIA